MSSHEPPHQTITVLLVDDHRFVATVVQSLLASESDIALHHCEHAADAVARATELAPDLILQDLVMPEVDGLTLVAAYRNNTTTARTPIVVLSGNDDDETKARAMAAGADDYMVKLPAKDALLACIRRHGQRDTTGSDDALAAFRQSMAGTPPELADVLIDQFIIEAEARVATLRDAATRDDGETLGLAAHSLKGSSLIMGANRLAALCGQVEKDAKTWPGRALTLMPAVDDEFTRLRDALARDKRDLGTGAAPAIRMVQR